MDRMKTLLESYYGVENRAGGPGGPGGSDLDSADLDAGAFVSGKLTSAGFASLLSADDALVQEVRTLDADMQLLVYDNYSKFISATDTIRSMKTNVDRIEGEIATLGDKVDALGSVADGIAARMGPKRSRIDKLVRLQGLLRKLNFLFELPQRLKQCIEMDAAPTAVDYYLRAMPILRKQQVASFAAIQRESEQIIGDLAAAVRKDLGKDWDSFNRNVRMLVRLGDADLAEPFLDWHEAYFDRRMEEVPRQLDTFVEYLFETVLDPLRETAETYRELFEPQEDEASAKAPDDGNSEGRGAAETGEAKAQGEDPVSALAKPVLTKFFNVVRARLVADDVAQGDAPTDGEAGGDGQGQGEKYRPLLTALNVLISRLGSYELPGVVRRGHLTDRTTEIAEHVVRKQVVDAFDQLRHRVTLELLALHDRVGDSARPLVAQPAAESEEAPQTVEGVAKAFVAAIERELGATMEQLERLLRECGVVLADIAVIFDNLIKFQLRFWALWLANALECACEPYHPCRKDGVAVGSRGGERAKLLVDMPSLPVVPDLLPLCLACVARLLPAVVSKRVGGELRELASTRDRLLLVQVETTGFRCEVGNLEVASSSAAAAPAVREFAVDIARKLQRLAAHVDACSPPGPAGAGPLSGGQSHAAAAGAGPRARPSGAVHSDIERMFSGNVKLLDAVRFTRESVLLGAWKVALKSLHEHVRAASLTQEAFQQLEVDSYFLRSVAAVMVEDATPANMLAKIVREGRARCLDPQAPQQEAVERAARAARERLRDEQEAELQQRRQQQLEATTGST